MWSSLLVVFVISLCAAKPDSNEKDSLEDAQVEKGKCIGPDNVKFAVGESWYDDESCTETTCIEVEGELRERVSKCMDVSDDPFCWEVDGTYGTSGRHPDCCPLIICTK